MRKRFRWWIVGAVVFLAASLVALKLSHDSLSGSFNREKVRQANILMVSLDTTRADRIGSYGYASAETPNIDRLAGEGVLFEQCITPTAYTLPSHSSIFTGLYPPHH